MADLALRRDVGSLVETLVDLDQLGYAVIVPDEPEGFVLTTAGLRWAREHGVDVAGEDATGICLETAVRFAEHQASEKRREVREARAAIARHKEELRLVEREQKRRRRAGG